MRPPVGLDCDVASDCTYAAPFYIHVVISYSLTPPLCLLESIKLTKLLIVCRTLCFVSSTPTPLTLSLSCQTSTQCFGPPVVDRCRQSNFTCSMLSRSMSGEATQHMHNFCVSIETLSATTENKKKQGQIVNQGKKKKL